MIVQAELDPKVQEIDKEMNGLFSKLDALCHNEFKPPQVVTRKSKDSSIINAFR